MTDNNMDRLLIIDGHNLLFQMFFGMPSRIVNKDGKAIHGTLGFIGALIKIIKRIEPTHLVVLFDSEHKNLRKELLADYKANRTDFSAVPENENPFSQLHYIYRALDLMGIKHTEVLEVETDILIRLKYHYRCSVNSFYKQRSNIKMYNIDLIKETFESQMNKKVISISKFDNVPNNQVFMVETELQPYIFKIYSSKWPEDDKLTFVAHKLDEYEIPHAQLLVFNRNDNNFPNGYLIEECLQGITADRLMMTIDETMKLYEKLAVLVSRVHTIELKNFGYTGGGVAMWTTFSEFIYDMFKDCTSNLRVHNLICAVKLEAIRQELLKRLIVCDQFPSVLCHGDLSTKNILVHSDEIVLIDWDDTHSLCWMADIARLTFWMKLNYDGETADTYRKVFLDRYETEYDKNIFYEIEDVLHVWYGLDYLNFSVGNPQYQYQYENVKSILQNSLKQCNMGMLD